MEKNTSSQDMVLKITRACVCSSRTNAYSSCSLPRRIVISQLTRRHRKLLLGGTSMNLLPFAFLYCKKHKNILQKYLSPALQHPPAHPVITAFMQYEQARLACSIDQHRRYLGDPCPNAIIEASCIRLIVSIQSLPTRAARAYKNQKSREKDLLDLLEQWHSSGGPSSSFRWC